MAPESPPIQPVPSLVTEVWKVPTPLETAHIPASAAIPLAPEMRQEIANAYESNRELLGAHRPNFTKGFEELFSPDTLDLLDLPEPVQAVALFIPYKAPDQVRYRVVYRQGDMLFYRGLLNQRLHRIDPNERGIQTANHIAYLWREGENLQWQVVNGGVGAKDFETIKNRNAYAKLLERVATGQFHDTSQWKSVEHYFNETFIFYDGLEQDFSRHQMTDAVTLTRRQRRTALTVESRLRKRYPDIARFQFIQLTLIGPNMDSLRFVPLAYRSEGHQWTLIDLTTGGFFETEADNFESALDYFKKESRYRRSDLEFPTFAIYTDAKEKMHVETMDPRSEWCGRRCQAFRHRAMEAVMEVVTLSPVWGYSPYDRFEGTPQWVGLTQVGIVTAEGVGLVPQLFAGESSLLMKGFGWVGAAVMVPATVDWVLDAVDDEQHRRYTDPQNILNNDKILSAYKALLDKSEKTE